MTTVYPEPQPVIMPQPMAAMVPPPVQWAPAQGARANCPAGLEQLCDLQVISILEDVNPAELTNNTHMPNHYSVRNPLNQQIYFVAEQPSVYTTANGPINLLVQDASGRVCMMINRSTVSYNCCGGSGVNSRMQVISGDGRKLGEALWLSKCCENKFEIRDDSDNFMFYATANTAAGVNNFVVDNGMNMQLGSVTRTIGDAMQQAYDAQNYQVTFPPDAHPTAKALLLGLAILIDYTYFENSYAIRRTNRSRRGRFGFGHHHSSFGHRGRGHHGRR